MSNDPITFEREWRGKVYPTHILVAPERNYSMAGPATPDDLRAAGWVPASTIAAWAETGGEFEVKVFKLEAELSQVKEQLAKVREWAGRFPGYPGGRTLRAILDGDTHE